MLRSIFLTSCLSVALATIPINLVKAEEFPVITRLVVREGTIIVTQNAFGKLKYSLIDHQGKEIETNISETQLEAKYPDIYNRFRPAVADTETSPWAGLIIKEN